MALGWVRRRREQRMPGGVLALSASPQGKAGRPIRRGAVPCQRAVAPACNRGSRRSRIAAMDETRTVTQTHERRAPPAAAQPYLFLALLCDRPLEKGARFSLAGV